MEGFLIPYFTPFISASFTAAMITLEDMVAPDTISTSVVFIISISSIIFSAFWPWPLICLRSLISVILWSDILTYTVTFTSVVSILPIYTPSPTSATFTNGTPKSDFIIKCRHCGILFFWKSLEFWRCTTIYFFKSLKEMSIWFEPTLLIYFWYR